MCADAARSEEALNNIPEVAATSQVQLHAQPSAVGQDPDLDQNPSHEKKDIPSSATAQGPVSCAAARAKRTRKDNSSDDSGLEDLLLDLNEAGIFSSKKHLQPDLMSAS